MRVNATEEEIKKLKDAADRAKATEDEVLFLKNKLQDEQRKFKELDEDKTSTEASLRAVQGEIDSHASQLKIYEKEIAEFKLNIPRIKQEKIMAFESGLLLA